MSAEPQPAPEPVFTREGDTFVPTEQAIGPWDRGQLHGGGPAALIGAAIQALAPDMQLARTTFEFLGPVPCAPITVEAQIVKPGKRLQLAHATVSAAGRTALTATCTLLRRSAIDVPPAARWEAPTTVARPASLEGRGWRDTPGFHTTGMTIRFAAGGFDEPGPATAWFALERDLVDGEPIVPVSRVMAAADFGNGVSAVLDWDRWVFINCDLSVTLLRDPRGPWVLLDSVTRIDAAGIGWASSTLADADGPIGFAQQTLYVAPR